jgi:single-stranded DNA-specific DHH superfamily exonuclease
MTAKQSFCDRAVQRFEDNRDEIMAFRAFDLLECLDVLVLGAVHDGQDLGDEVRFITRPVAA